MLNRVHEGIKIGKVSRIQPVKSKLKIQKDKKDKTFIDILRGAIKKRKNK